MHFNSSVTFLLLVLEILKKYHKGDLAGHCPIYGTVSEKRVLRYKILKL